MGGREEDQRRDGEQRKDGMVAGRGEGTKSARLSLPLFRVSGPLANCALRTPTASLACFSHVCFPSCRIQRFHPCSATKLSSVSDNNNSGHGRPRQPVRGNRWAWEGARFIAPRERDAPFWGWSCDGFKRRSGGNRARLGWDRDLSPLWHHPRRAMLLGHWDRLAPSDDERHCACTFGLP
jgi:hypothetical protein